MSENKLIIGSRASKLALWQTHYVAETIKARFHTEIEIVHIKTEGDKILDAPLSRIGGKGLFVKEIETALLEGKIDLAVHSMKDVPTELPKGLIIKAMTERADPSDVLISKDNVKLKDLPVGSTIGTSSLRRQAQLLSIRPDFKIKDVRGNLDTRIRKMKEGQYDAMILAAAGLDRLEFSDVISERLPVDVMVSAVGQGSIGIEIREDDTKTAKYVSILNDPDTFDCVTAERALLKQLEGGCQVPIGALARINDGMLDLVAIVASLDGKEVYTGNLSGAPLEAETLGYRLATQLSDDGADAILADVRATFGADEEPDSQ